MRAYAKRAALALAGAALALALVEGFLAFRGAPRGWETGRAGPDVVLEEGVGRRFGPGKWNRWNTDFTINANGLRGAPVEGRPEVLALGDSCTFGLGVPDDGNFASLLAGRKGGAAVAAMPGYSSFQGLRLYENPRIAMLRPRLVTIYFGWNDHDLGVLPELELYWFRRAARWSRLAFSLASLEEGRWRDDGIWPRLRWCRRVPLGLYEETMEELARRAKASGAAVVIITGAYDLPRAGVHWPHTHFHRVVGDQLLYNDAAREAARRAGVGLLDFAAEVDRLPAGRRHRLFGDMVHPSAAGHALLAARLKPFLDAAPQ